MRGFAGATGATGAGATGAGATRASGAAAGGSFRPQPINRPTTTRTTNVRIHETVMTSAVALSVVPRVMASVTSFVAPSDAVAALVSTLVSAALSSRP